MARGGLYGQAEIVLYGGRGPAALEVYWDGAPYLPVGRDSVYLDPGRIPLAPLERVDVIVLPATLRIYLVTRRQASSADHEGGKHGPINKSGTTAAFSSGGVRAWVSWWRTGRINVPGIVVTTSFRDVDL